MWVLTASRVCHRVLSAFECVEFQTPDSSALSAFHGLASVILGEPC